MQQQLLLQWQSLPASSISLQLVVITITIIIVVAAATATAGTQRCSGCLHCSSATIRLQLQLQLFTIAAVAAAAVGRRYPFGGLGACAGHAEHAAMFAQIGDVIDAILVLPFYLFVLHGGLCLAAIAAG